MKIGYLIGGILLGLFGLAQLLQLCGLIGIGFTLAGVGFTILGLVGSFACFQKAFAKSPDQS
jgi:hypothetical protein